MNLALAEVALFPIPNVVAFPGSVVPLHIFEPRYRAMINDAVSERRMIGVCHTQKEISPAKKDQTITQALHSNQATYAPCEVFSAGFCEIVETTSDGRIYANISMQHRYQLLDEIQTLPYRIVSCSEVTDLDQDNEETHRYKIKITEQILEIIGTKNPALIKVLQSEKMESTTCVTVFIYTLSVFAV